MPVLFIALIKSRNKRRLQGFGLWRRQQFEKVLARQTHWSCRHRQVMPAPTLSNLWGLLHPPHISFVVLPRKILILRLRGNYMILIYDFGNFRRSLNALSAFIWLKKNMAPKIYFCSVVLEIRRGIRCFQSGSKFLNCMKVVDRPIL